MNLDSELDSYNEESFYIPDTQRSKGNEVGWPN